MAHIITMKLATSMTRIKRDDILESVLLINNVDMAKLIIAYITRRANKSQLDTIDKAFYYASKKELKRLE